MQFYEQPVVPYFVECLLVIEKASVQFAIILFRIINTFLQNERSHVTSNVLLKTALEWVYWSVNALQDTFIQEFFKQFQ